jgi:endonuclease/exonuclease/phosphatase family metal-dependent hydrolase
VGGGLLLLSRFPCEGEPHFITYKNASRVLTHGPKADGLAAKGAIHVRLRVDDDCDLAIDCFLTHLESISRKARAKQINELAGFIAKHASPERPLILMGDMNTAADYPLKAPRSAGGSAATAPPPRSEYRKITNALRCGGKKLVDVWAAARWQVKTARVEPFLDEKVKQGSLSDHAGVECELALHAPELAWLR